MRSWAVSETWTAVPAALTEADFFDRLDHRPFAFLYGEGRFLVLAQEPLASLTDDVLPEMAWERRGALPPILPDWIGFIGYGWGHRLEPLAGTPRPTAFPFPELQLVLHREVRIFDRATGLLHTGLRSGVTAEDDRPHLLREGAFEAVKQSDSECPASYGEKVQRIREEIAAGNVYQVNLTRQEVYGHAGDLRTLARRLCKANPAPFSALLAGPEGTVLSSSPERLLKVQEGWIETRPIKGTAPRSGDAREDQALAEALLASPKNRSELAMIVDLLRNDLARVCVLPEVRVDAFPELESYANVHHLVATVRGRLRPGLTFRNLLEGLFPGGSVTGCPKLAAMQLIRELEPFGRGPYCGALGWMRHDLGQLDLALPIRTAFADAEQLAFGVGGGIVWDSEPVSEYEETVHKGRSLVACLR